jgi:carboxyl-terminal processing protease
MSVNKWILVQMVVIIVLSFFIGYKTHQFETAGIEILPEWIANSSVGEFALGRVGDDGVITLKDFKTVQQVFEFMQTNFIRNDVTREKLLEGAISGGVYALGDRYSRFVPPSESKQLQDDIEGFYGGIGILVEPLTNGRGAMITSAFKTGPAYEAGVMAGDIITKVDGADTSELLLNEIVGKIKGPEKTKVKITVYRPAIDDVLEFEMERKRVKYPSVFDPKILEGTDKMGYVHLIQFNNESAKDMQSAVDELTAKGMKSLILDLRQNTGGSFDPAVKIADMFIPDGAIVYTEDRNGKLNEFDSKDGGKKLDIPVVVLVDSFSASASEILAGAIKDYKAGTIMGTKTFGKGVVQNVVNIPDGGTLILTTSKYLTPLKNDINEKGIMPDIVADLDLSKTSDPILKQKYEQAEKYREEIIKLRDDILKRLREYDYQLEAAKEYLATGKLIEGAKLAEDVIKEEEQKKAETSR